MGPDGKVYVGDGESRPRQVWVFLRDVFIDAVREKQIAARHWTVVLPRSDCLVKIFQLPAHTLEEARRMLEFEVATQVPIPPERLSYDLLPLPDGTRDELRYLVFLTPRQRLDRAVSVLHEAGVEPDRIIPSTLALLTWWRDRRSPPAVRHPASEQAPATRHHEGRTLLLAVDRARCEMVFDATDHLLATDRIDAQPLQDSQLARLLRPLAPPTGTDEGEPGSTVPCRVVVAGDPALVGRLAERVREQVGLDAETCPLDVVLAGGPTWAEGDSKHVHAVDVLCAAGACLPEAFAQSFNVLPVDWQSKRWYRQRWIERVKTGAALAMAVALSYAWLLVATSRMEKRCHALMQRIEPIREIAAELEMKKRQTAILHAQLSNRALPLQVLAELYRTMPANMYLSHLSMDLNPNEPQLKMRGPAGSLDAAFAFPLVLEESPLFFDVRPESAQQVTRGEGVLVEFGCGCRIHTAASARGPNASGEKTRR